MLAPGEGVEVPQGFVHERGDDEVSDWPESRRSGCGVACTSPHDCDKKGAEPEPKGKALDLRVKLRPYPHLWS